MSSLSHEETRLVSYVRQLTLVKDDADPAREESCIDACINLPVPSDIVPVPGHNIIAHFASAGLDREIVRVYLPDGFGRFDRYRGITGIIAGSNSICVPRGDELCIEEAFDIDEVEPLGIKMYGGADHRIVLWSRYRETGEHHSLAADKEYVVLRLGLICRTAGLTDIVHSLITPSFYERNCRSPAALIGEEGR